MARKSRIGFFSALKYGDGISKFEMVVLCFVSALCATCNVLLPYLQKRILESIGADNGNDSLLWVYLLVGIGGAIALAAENFINVAIMMRLRRALERAMLYSIAYKEQPMLQEKGIGVFASATVGDSEQLARVLAAGWFSIIFNLIGAIVSIIISATWNNTFLIISLVAYLLVLAVIYIFNGLSVYYFRKEKVLSYHIAFHIREVVESHRSIISYGSFDGFQEKMGEEFALRTKYYSRSENMTNIGSALIKLIQAVALGVFFFYAVTELRNQPDEAGRAAFYPILVALVSYFATIFAPIASINATYNNASKFRAFYDPFKEVVTFSGLGGLPENLDVNIVGIEQIQNTVLILDGISLDMSKTYGIVGLHGESKAALLSIIRGETVPWSGNIRMAGVPFSEIEKNLRFSLFSINPSAPEVFENGLEFNVTLGKPLLNNAEYDAKKNEYFDMLRHFFELVDHNCAFRRKKDKQVLVSVIADFYSLDVYLRNQKRVRDHVVAAFASIEDREAFIESVGNSIFSKKYAKRARYEKIVSELSLYSLENREFGLGGKKLLESERALLLLARFLLPENKNPYLLLSPLEHVPFEIYSRAITLIQTMTKGRKGLVIMPDLDAMRALSDEIIVMEGGHIVERGKHANLIRRKSKYAEIYADAKKSLRAVNK